MIDTAVILKTIRSIPQDSKLYLLENFSASSGLFALNGNAIYLVANTERCHSISIKTEYLRLDTNTYVSAFNDSATTYEDGFYNSVELQLSDIPESEANLSAFINLCISHATYMEGRNIVSFFDSLVSLFQLPREQNYMNLVGLYGELSIIKYFHEKYNQDLSIYWHTTGSMSKLDFVTPVLNIEVKTTSTDKLSFKIKHEQLFENSNDTYLAAVSISENNAGITLDELVTSMLKSVAYCNSLNFAINLEAERRKISPVEASHKRFCLNNIKLYSANEICPFDAIPEIVTDLSYTLNLATSSYEDNRLIAGKIAPAHNHTTDN